MRLIENSIATQLYKVLNESEVDSTQAVYDALDGTDFIVNEVYSIGDGEVKFNVSAFAYGDTDEAEELNRDVVVSIPNDDYGDVKQDSYDAVYVCVKSWAEEHSTPDTFYEGVNMTESEDAARDLGIEPGSDEEYMLNSLYDESMDEEPDVEYEIWQRYYDDDGLPARPELVIVLPSYENAAKYAQGLMRDPNCEAWIEEKKLNEAEEVKKEKKVTKIEVDILPTVKFVWAEGNQDHVKALFGSAEEHDMDFSKFQNAVYVLDQEVAERDGGYDKVKYIANIQVKFTYSDGSTEEETTTYTGRVDCGDGYKYVTVSKNMKHHIQEEYKDAEVIVREDSTAELKESASFDEIVIDSYNHFTNDLGKNPTVDDIVDDILKNYDQEYINDDTPENSLQACKDVKYVLSHNNLSYEDLNESATYEVDMTIEDNIEDEINKLLKSNNADGVQYKVVNTQGVGGGWPIVRFYGEDNKVRDFLGKIGYEDIETYKINESEKPEETLDEVIKKDAEMAWEVGKPYREFREFEKIYKDMGYTVTEKDYSKYEEYYDDCKALEQDSLKESEETNMTLKEYAMKLHEGYIDMDVCDTEIDMVVAFVCDFNETPTDNYDKFLHLLGERTKVVKANEWSLVCDFTSVFKPYEDKLREFFDMDYSEFDEAYYEAVVNLEGLVSGMSGEKTYGELIDILNS